MVGDGGGGGGEGDGALGFSLTGLCTALFFSISESFFGLGGDDSGVTSSDFFSDGATWATPSPDLDMTATFVPGSTVSPSLATNYT